jgi:hypothetical protein
VTATPPRTDLRTLATVAAHDVDCPDGPNCGDELTTDGRYGRYADAVLAAVLPEHRRLVLAEALDATPDTPFDLIISFGPAMGGYFRPETVDLVLRRLAAAAPPAGPSATVPAGNAPAVPEEADGQRAGEGVDYGPCPHTDSLGRLHLEWLAEVADLKAERDALRQHILDIDAHATPRRPWVTCWAGSPIRPWWALSPSWRSP